MKKRKWQLVTVLFALSISLTSCGADSEKSTNKTNNTTVTTVTTSETTESTTTTTSKTEIDPPTELYTDFFEPLIDSIGTISVEEFQTMKKEELSKYEISITEGNEDDQWKYFISDTNDDHVSIWFYPDNVNADYKDWHETICLITYDRGNKEISVSDNYHLLKEPEYKTFDKYAETPSHTVTNKIELKDFIFEKEETTKPEQNITDLDVDIGYEYEKKGNNLVFTINTNLPDETIIMLSLESDNGPLQDKVIVKNGKATQEKGFSTKGKEIKGHITLDVTMISVRLQSEAVQSVIGIEGEALKGKYVNKDEITGNNSVSASFEIDIE